MIKTIVVFAYMFLTSCSVDSKINRASPNYPTRKVSVLSKSNPITGWKNGFTIRWDTTLTINGQLYDRFSYEGIYIKHRDSLPQFDPRYYRYFRIDSMMCIHEYLRNSFDTTEAADNILFCIDDSVGTSRSTLEGDIITKVSDYEVIETSLIKVDSCSKFNVRRSSEDAEYFFWVNPKLGFIKMESAVWRGAIRQLEDSTEINL